MLTSLNTRCRSKLKPQVYGNDAIWVQTFLAASELSGAALGDFPEAGTSSLGWAFFPERLRNLRGDFPVSPGDSGSSLAAEARARIAVLGSARFARLADPLHGA